MSLQSGTVIYAPLTIADDTDLYPAAYSSQIQGGRRVVADLTALYALAWKPLALQENVTIVSVIDDGTATNDYILIDINNIGNSSGWQLYTSYLGASSTNIYNSDGTIAANRNVSLSGKSLKFAGTTSPGLFLKLDDAGTYTPTIALSAVNVATLGSTLSMGVNGATLSYSNSGISSISFGTNITITDTNQFQGAAYAADYSANFTARSLIDKGYADATYLSSSTAVNGLVYKGTWNASTNSPAITSGVGTLGWFYKVSVAGTTTIDGVSQWNIGDILLFDGTAWDKIDGVSSDINLYTGDGSLTGNRTVSTGSNDLNFGTYNTSSGAIRAYSTTIIGLQSYVSGTNNKGFLYVEPGALILGVDDGVGDSQTLHFVNDFTTPITLTDVALAKGIVYANDYSANFTARSLIDRGFADATYTPIGGGVNIYNTDGSLTGARTVDINSRSLFLSANDGTYGGQNSFLLQSGLASLKVESSSDNLSIHNGENLSLLSFTGNSSTIGGTYTPSGTGQTGYFKNIAFTKTGIVITDDEHASGGGNVYAGAGGRGMMYAADYSTNYTSRSLVDKGFVVSYVPSAPLTGLSITGGAVVATDSVLAAFGKVQNQINGIAGGLIYKGVWNASTNSPAITSGTGTLGWFYKVGTAGTTSIDGVSTWNVGDILLFDGITWDKIDGVSSEVLSFNTRVGAITLSSGDVTTALTYTPENPSNKATTFGTINNTKYPTTQAVSDFVAANALIDGNGTTANGTSVDLGGNLTGTTKIITGSNQFYVGTSAFSGTYMQLLGGSSVINLVASNAANSGVSLDGTGVASLYSQGGVTRSFSVTQSGFNFVGLTTVTPTLAIGIDGSGNFGTYALSGGGISALTGDITASGAGSVVATLATVNLNVGSFTNPNFTVNAKGLITSASNGTGAATSTQVTDEDHTSATNGVTTVFTTVFTPIAGSIQVFKNGQLLRIGAGNDYTVSGSNVTFATAPLTGAVILFTYLVASTTAAVTSITTPGVLFNTPVTITAGAAALTFINQSANTFLAGPATGGAATPTMRTIVAADIPTLNQNTSGTAANLSGTPALPNGTTAATQTAGDNTAKLATTAFVTAAVSAATTGVSSFNTRTGAVTLTSGDINSALGTPTPASLFHSSETSSSTIRGGIFDQYSTDTAGSKIYGRKARGTFASPLTIVTGDTIASHTWSAYTNAFTDAAKILVTSIGTISSGVVPATLALQTANASGVLTTGILIDQSQNVTITQPILTTSSTAGYVWTATNTSGAGSWQAATGGFANPMTGVGDLILGGAAGAATRLAIGANTLVLTSNGTTASWQAAGTGTVTSITGGTGLTGGPITTTGSLAIDQTFTPTWTGLHIFQGGINTSGNITKAATGSNTQTSITGLNINVAAANYTDNSTAAGTTIIYTSPNVIGIPTITASNATSGSKVTYTNAATLTILGVPVAGTNTLLTTPLSLSVVGNSNFTGTTTVSNLTCASVINFSTGNMSLGSAGGTMNLSITSATGVGSQTSAAAFLPSGASQVNYGVGIGGVSSTLPVGNSYGRFIVSGASMATNTSGTSVLLAGTIFMPPAFALGSGSTTTNAATVEIDGPPTTSGAGTLTNPVLSLFIKSGNSQLNGNLILGVAGNGLFIKEGTNASMGQGTLSSGALTVSTTKVTANSRIFLTDQGGTITNLGTLYISARTAGTSFTVSSSNVLDSSTFAWIIIEPAP